MSDCLFCKFVRDEIPTRLAYRDDLVMAFEDINPQAPNHILIIPTKHIASVNELTAEDVETVGQMYLTAQKIAQARGFAVEGYRTVINVGPNAGQTVFHLHMHLLAGRAFRWPPG
jgi:histidine triad (HIT) family protein